MGLFTQVLDSQSVHKDPTRFDPGMRHQILTSDLHKSSRENIGKLVHRKGALRNLGNGSVVPSPHPKTEHPALALLESSSPLVESS